MNFIKLFFNLKFLVYEINDFDILGLLKLYHRLRPSRVIK